MPKMIQEVVAINKKNNSLGRCLSERDGKCEDGIPKYTQGQEATQ